MKIVVLAGGLSDERNVSLSSGCKVCAALRQRGHQAALVDMYLGAEGDPQALFSAPIPAELTKIGRQTYQSLCYLPQNQKFLFVCSG